jgi:hypothetical protein
MLLAVGLQGCLLPADLAVELVVAPDRVPDRAALGDAAIALAGPSLRTVSAGSP